MAEYNLGQVAIVSKGAYSSGTSYVPLNAVSHNGGAFLCTAACSGIEPGVASNWQNYWMSITRGMRSYSTTVSNGVATATVTFTDGTTYSFSYSTSAVSAGAVGNEQLAANAVATGNLQNKSVTAAKLGDDVIKVYVSASVPSSSSPDGVYIVTG